MPAEIIYKDIKVAPFSTGMDEPVNFTIVLTNIGELQGTENVELVINGTVYATETVTLGANESRILFFIKEFTVPGYYTAVIGTETAPFNITKPEIKPEPKPAKIIYDSIEVSPQVISVGENITVSIILSNTGEVKGDETVSLYIENELWSTETISIEPGETETISITKTINTRGVYSVKTGTTSILISTFTVKESEKPPEPNGGSQKQIPGYPLITMLLAFTIFTLLMRMKDN